MGLVEALAHFLIKVCLNSLIMFFVLLFLLEIPYNKIPMLLLVSFLSGAAAHVIASLLLAGRRGY